MIGLGKRKRLIRAMMTYMGKAVKSKVKMIIIFDPPLSLLERNLNGARVLLYKRYFIRTATITMMRVARIMVIMISIFDH